MDSTKGGIVVTNGAESSLVSKVKENKDKDRMFISEEYWFFNKEKMVC